MRLSSLLFLFIFVASLFIKFALKYVGLMCRGGKIDREEKLLGLILVGVDVK